MYSHLFSFIEETGFQLCLPRQFKIKARRLPLEVQSRITRSGRMAFEACLFKYLSLLPELTCSVPMFSSEFETALLDPIILAKIALHVDQDDLPNLFFIALGWVFHHEGLLVLHEWFSDAIDPLVNAAAVFYKTSYGEELVFTEPLETSAHLRNVEVSLAEIPSFSPNVDDACKLSGSLSLTTYDQCLRRNSARRVNSCYNLRGWHTKSPRRPPGIPRRNASIEFGTRGRSEARFGPRPQAKSSDHGLQIRRILPLRLQSFQNGEWRRFAIYNTMFLTSKPPMERIELAES